jgi:hypothetical protein
VLGAGGDASNVGSGSGAGAGTKGGTPHAGSMAAAVVVGVQGSEGGGKGGEGDQNSEVHWISGDMGVMFSGERLGEGDGCVDCGSDEGDDVSYERGDTRRLESSSLSLNNLTSHCLFSQ